MTRASELGRGTYTQIGEPKLLNARMTELFSKIGHPVITDLKAALSGGAKITPENLPDLYRGEPVMFYADAASLSGVVKITGKIGDQPWEVSLPVAKAASGAGISKLWARRKIAEFEVAATLGQMQQADMDKAILAVALEHQLVSSQTSLIAVDNSPKRPAGYQLTRADVPLNLPAGWVWESVFGEMPQQDAPKYDQKTEADLKQLIKTTDHAAAMPDADQVPLAAGGTDGVMMALVGLLLGLMGFSLMRKTKAVA